MKTYTVIVSKGFRDYTFEQVRRFWAETKIILLDMGDHHVTVRDYDGLIIKGDDNE